MTPTMPGEMGYGGPTIIRAAIKVGDDIYHSAPPARHGLLLHRYKLGDKPHVQGFLTNTGEFVSREDARKIALAAGQITEPTHCGHSTKLFSEDLW